MEKEELISLLLRLSLIFSFAFAGISSLLFPSDWIGFIPRWIKDIFPGELLLLGFSLWEIILSLWLLSNKFIFYAALASILTFLAIILPNIALMSLIFRDISILIAAIALAVLNRSQEK